MMSDAYVLALTKVVKAHKALLDACDNKDSEQIPSLVEEFNFWKDKLLSEKELNGFEPNLAFLEDQSFAAFRIVNGRLIGDEVEAYILAGKWAEKYNAGALPEIFYDVSFFIFFNVNMEYVKEQLQERRKRTA